MTTVARSRVLGALVTVVAIAAVAIGIVLLGSPADERARRLDQRRVQDLSGIARAVNLHWTRHASLPPSLEQLQQAPGADIRSTDPTTGDAYEYRPLDGTTYELCARFEHESARAGRPAGIHDIWSHGGGRQCFQREAQKVRG
jgi:hypothetical protein